ncbi:MAG: hypothetical protein AAF902_00820 [Chloroflexota bacterium]
MSDQIQSKDTGKDCPYCGGVIYRVENESGNVKTAFHNCNSCGARWSDNWSLTSPGSRNYNQESDKSARPRSTIKKNFNFDITNLNIPNWGWIVIVLAVTFILLRLNVLSLLNLLLIPMTLIIFGYIIFRIGKEQRWW